MEINDPQFPADRVSVSSALSGSAAICSFLREDITTTSAPESNCLSFLDKKRLELELGPGSDHDIPYSFALPASLPQVLAWMRLLAKVHRGELEP